MTPRTLIIAEIGENHVGDWDRARRMIEEAAAAGADVVKFQSYRGRDVSPEDPEREWFGQVELPDPLHFELRDLARRCGVEFLSTPFTLERARFLCEKVGLTSLKIASSEMLNIPLLDYADRRAKKVYLSTGMSEPGEIREAVGRLSHVEELTVMHCVTQYPLQDEDAHLRAILVLAEMFPSCRIGYSDHTVGSEAPLLAVALGATVIEKHFTLDKSLPGTDHVLSATPEELKRLVASLRRAEKLLGEKKKQPIRQELLIRDQVRQRFRKEALR